MYQVIIQGSFTKDDGERIAKEAQELSRALDVDATFVVGKRFISVGGIAAAAAALGGLALQVVRFVFWLRDRYGTRGDEVDITEATEAFAEVAGDRVRFTLVNADDPSRLLTDHGRATIIVVDTTDDARISVICETESSEIRLSFITR
jgi:hypothetical protein